ncbi:MULTISPECIES: DUF3631 domain-containing protein [unclassified Nocardia]|uniref:DUF3631 domain-containing protein n=1 Tax=unclassified Nocardia TaxID=2637762 RepID=UPI001CE3D5EB|nr:MULTISPECIES: DUF3631 domain-containing protein [unclassified Nocardia]
MTNVDYSNAALEPPEDVSPVELSGAAVLDEVLAALRTFCVFPTVHAEVGVVLWVATTHLTAAFEYAPRLVLRSAEKRSGKSRALEVIDALVYKPLRAVNATVPFIFRSLTADPPPTLLFDECDTIFGSKKVAEQNEDLRGLLNAGFQRGLTFGRVVGPNHKPQEFNTFAMAALAGIGRMPDTIEDRAVVIEMKRRKSTEKVSPYRTRRDRPPLDQLRETLAAWADSVREELDGYEPDDLGVEDRAADVWEPLISVADMAGGTWPKLARSAAVAMVAAAEAADESTSTNLRLLADIREIFTTSGEVFLKSAVLCAKLCALDESPWQAFDFNPSKLGHRLREYGIKTDFRDSYKTERGYRLDTFVDAFERYLPAPKPPEGVQAAQNGTDQQQRLDGFTISDTFKASEDSGASDDNHSSDAVSDTSDGFGRPAKRTCPECGLDGVPGGHQRHHDCQSQFERREATGAQASRPLL